MVAIVAGGWQDADLPRVGCQRPDGDHAPAARRRGTARHCLRARQQVDYPVMVAVAAAPNGTHALLVAAHNNDYFGDLLEISISPDHPATARPFAVGPDNGSFRRSLPMDGGCHSSSGLRLAAITSMVRSFPEPTSSLQISPDTLLTGRPFWSADGQSVGYQNQIGAAVFETRLKLAGGLAVLSRAAIPVPMAATVPARVAPGSPRQAFPQWRPARHQAGEPVGWGCRGSELDHRVARAHRGKRRQMSDATSPGGCADGPLSPAIAAGGVVPSAGVRRSTTSV